MSKIDVSSNRIPFGLLTSEEQAEMMATASVAGAKWYAFVDGCKWEYVVTLTWRNELAYRVHLPAAPVEPKPEPVGKVEYWRHKHFDRACKTENRIIVDTNGNPNMIDSQLLLEMWLPITAAEYEAAKARWFPVYSPHRKVETPVPKRIEYLCTACPEEIRDKMNELIKDRNEMRGAR